MTGSSHPHCAVVNLDTGEVIPLDVFAREHLDNPRLPPSSHCETAHRPAAASIRIELPRPGDALASCYFAPPPELD